MNICDRINAVRRELTRKHRQVGLWGTVRHIAGKLMLAADISMHLPDKEEDPFDPKYGTDTAGIIGVGSLDIPEDQMVHAMHYGPIWEDEFMRTLDELQLACEELVFVDLGSGKGRALLLASLFPFRKIIGVELSAMLHDTAVRNIKIFKDPRQKCYDIRAICEDASAFPIPKEPILFFLCNPFDDHVMHAVVSHIEKSLKRFPRKIYVWYVKPNYREVLDRAELLQIVTQADRYVFYESKHITSQEVVPE